MNLSRSLLGAALLVAAVSGCREKGPELAKVDGYVKLDGRPVANAMVEFQPREKGSPSVGYTDKSGYYQLRFSRDRWGAMPGEHTVRIDWDWEPGSDDPKPEFKIAQKYNKKSELTAKVATGSNSFDFEIQPEPGKAKKAG